jgi:hypothetical protein
MEKNRMDSIYLKWFWCAVYFLCIIPVGHAQFFTDAYIIGGTGNNASIQDVLIDADTSYLYGTYTSEMNIEDIELSHVGEGDIFLAKRVHEEIEWIFYGGSSGNDFVANIALDESNNIYIGGSFTNEAYFGNLTLNSSGSSRAIFTIGLSPEGEILEHHIVNSTGQKDLAGIVLVDDQIYLAGSFGDTLFIDGIDVVSTAEQDIFLIKLAMDNDPAWIQNYGLAGKSDAVDFSWSEIGKQFIVSGHFDNQIHVADDTIQTNTFDEDLFLAAFTIDGDGKWIRKLGGQFDDFNEAHAIDEEGNIYLTGDYRGIIGFDDGTDINTGGITNSDSYLIKCDMLGSRIWARTLGNQGQEFGTDVIVQEDQVYWSGYHNKAYSVDGILFKEPTGSLAGAYAIFHPSDGQLEANLNIQSTSIVVPLGLAGFPGGVQIFGDFSGETTFDQMYNVEQNFAGFLAEINLQSVSTDDQTLHKDILVYPNPTGDQVNISLGTEAQSLIIYDQLGIAIFENASPQVLHQVDLSSQADGIYFWVSSEGWSGRIIKKRVPH